MYSKARYTLTLNSHTTYTLARRDLPRVGRPRWPSKMAAVDSVVRIDVQRVLKTRVGLRRWTVNPVRDARCKNLAAIDHVLHQVCGMRRSAVL